VKRVIIEGIDVESGVKRFGGKEDRYLKALRSFAKGLETDDRPMSGALCGENAEAFAAKIHTIKGVAGNMGAVVLHEAISEFEKTLRTGNPDEGLYGKMCRLIKDTKDNILNASGGGGGAVKPAKKGSVSEPRGVQSGEDRRKYSVLIADDSEENINALLGMLEDSYTVYVATNGEQALEVMDKKLPDLVLLDVVMPGISGFEVLRRMKTDKRFLHTPVIFITSTGDSFSEAQGLMLGAVDYIIKPYNPDIVSIKVRNQMDNKLHRDNLEQLVEQRAAQLIKSSKELRKSQEAIIFGMSYLAERRDLGTGTHLKRMKRITEILAKRLRAEHPDYISEDEVNKITMYAPLHDIGKVAISDSILLKPDILTPEEFETVKGHTSLGAEILLQTNELLDSNSRGLVIAIDIAMYHHEKFDGSGYPKGLKGTKIPLSARIVALADVYDALTSKREYKEAYSHSKAREIILNGDGRTSPEHFDPLILDVFKLCAGDMENIHRQI
jgi:putative two-component system response regulator